MSFEVRITSKAEKDVDEILRWYLEQSAVAAAQRWLDQLLAKVESLENRPTRCVIAKEAKDVGIELRELLFGKRQGTYRILFEISGKKVHILHIRHAARDILTERDLR